MQGDNCDLPRSNIFQLQPLCSLQRLPAQGTDYLMVGLAEEGRRYDTTVSGICIQTYQGGSRQVCMYVCIAEVGASQLAEACRIHSSLVAARSWMKILLMFRL